MTDLEFMKTVDIHRISQEGTRIYNSIKDRYLPQYKGDHLAIDIDSGDVFRANFASDAVESALKIHPGKVFFLVKIGYSAEEQLSRL